MQGQGSLHMEKYSPLFKGGRRVLHNVSINRLLLPVCHRELSKPGVFSTSILMNDALVCKPNCIGTGWCPVLPLTTAGFATSTLSHFSHKEQFTPGHKHCSCRAKPRKKQAREKKILFFLPQETCLPNALSSCLTSPCRSKPFPPVTFASLPSTARLKNSTASSSHCLEALLTPGC